MKQSHLFTKTRKEVPADEVAQNAQLLIRAGYIHKEMAGVYDYLPLGLRVIGKIKSIVREEMNNIDGQELIMSNLQTKSVWEKTTRWDEKIVDIWFKTNLQDGTDLGLAWSHEEPIMQMMQQYVKSYKDLPVSVYQFQNKLRNELRSKSGVMRGREFLMKDMYSLHATVEDLEEYYEKVKSAYKKIYDRFGIGEDTFVTFASGGAFTKYSHEFQTVCEVGEDILYLNRDENIAINEEVLDDAVKEFGFDREKLEKVQSAEVGNIFNFGAEKSEQMEIFYTDKSGKQQPIYLASYGIGISRAMGVIVEKFADAKGIIWPESVAPFKVHLIELEEGLGAEVYKKLQKDNIEVLYDDRSDVSPGEKFNDADLIGIPWRLVVSKKTDGKIECKRRTEEDIELLDYDQLIRKLS